MGDDGGYIVPQQQDEAERARERRENRPDNLHEPEHQELGPFAFAACRQRFDHRGGEVVNPPSRPVVMAVHQKITDPEAP